MKKRQTIFFVILMSILFAIHLYFLIMELIPRTLYPPSITVNYISLALLIEVVITTLLCLLKQKYGSGIIIINLLLLIPAVIVYRIEASCLESYSKDSNTYLKFDKKETLQEVSSYFPLELNKEYIENYIYFYETFDIVLYAGTNVEVCLELKYNANDYRVVLNSILNQYPKETLKVFEYDEKYKEISFVDSIDYTMPTIKKGNVKKILVCEENCSIVYVYISIEDKINKDKLFYFQNIVNVL